MRIGLFTDIHANLPALQRCLDRFQELNCDRIIHIGDLIGIGPYPKECLDLALSVKEMEFIMGNHDYWYAYGLPKPIPSWMSKEEVAHQNWTHQEIGPLLKGEVKKWKFSIEIPINENRKVSFQHYALNESRNWFKSILKNPTIKGLDDLFKEVKSEVIFYGHQHKANDTTGKKRYVNLGSAGCFNKPEARIGILEMNTEKIKLTKETLVYEDNGLMEAFEHRQVPARDFIKKVFIKR